MQKKSINQQPARRHASREIVHDSRRQSDFAAGVRWFGVEEGDEVVHASDCDTGERRNGRPTLVFGSAHGPRLLEAIGACAC